TGLDTLDGLDDLTVRESRLLHAVELLNEKILLLTTSLFREDYPRTFEENVVVANLTEQRKAQPLRAGGVVSGVVEHKCQSQLSWPAASRTVCPLLRNRTAAGLIDKYFEFVSLSFLS
ncbi:hypothetical protein LGN04_19125, partial [Burkholderia multivorans]|nr:hypothetical protein [Burkholderia multivorans]